MALPSTAADGPDESVGPAAAAPAALPNVGWLASPTGAGAPLPPPSSPTPAARAPSEALRLGVKLGVRLTDLLRVALGERDTLLAVGVALADAVREGGAGDGVVVGGADGDGAAGGACDAPLRLGDALALALAVALGLALVLAAVDALAVCVAEGVRLGVALTVPLPVELRVCVALALAAAVALALREALRLSLGELDGDEEALTDALRDVDRVGVDVFEGDLDALGLTVEDGVALPLIERVAEVERVGLRLA